MAGSEFHDRVWPLDVGGVLSLESGLVLGACLVIGQTGAIPQGPFGRMCAILERSIPHTGRGSVCAALDSKFLVPTLMP